MFKYFRASTYYVLLKFHFERKRHFIFTNLIRQWQSWIVPSRNQLVYTRGERGTSGSWEDRKARCGDLSPCSRLHGRPTIGSESGAVRVTHPLLTAPLSSFLQPYARSVLFHLAPPWHGTTRHDIAFPAPRRCCSSRRIRSASASLSSLHFALEERCSASRRVCLERWLRFWPRADNPPRCDIHYTLPVFWMRCQCIVRQIKQIATILQREFSLPFTTTLT